MTVTKTAPPVGPYPDADTFRFRCPTCDESYGPYATRGGAQAAHDRHHDTAHGPAAPEPARATAADMLHDGLLVMGAGIPSGLGINHGVYWASGEFLPWWLRCGIGLLCGVAAMLGLRTWRSRAAGRETQA